MTRRLGSGWLTLAVMALAVMLVLWSTPGALAGHADKGPNPFADMRGVRWKPGQAKRDVLITKAPYAGAARNASVEERAAAEREVAQRVVSNLGANATSIDVSPFKKVWKSLYEEGQCPNPETTALTQQCRDRIRSWKNNQYRQIARFIDNVIESGAVPPDFKFYLHSRVNGRGEFIGDMVKAIAAVDAAGRDANLAGVMIGEHDRWEHPGGSDGYLQLTLNIAREINSRTSGWLREQGRGVTVHGGGFGVDFNGIGAAINTLDFFEKIQAETQFFAFTFKYFLGEGNNPYVTPEPISSGADEQQREAKIQEWMAFFRDADDADGDAVDGVNLDGLRGTLRGSRVRDAHLAPYTNVVFVGDSADGLFAVHTRANGSDDPDGPIINEAMIRVFEHYQEVDAADGITDTWRSFMFGQPLDHRDLDESVKRGIWGGSPRVPQRPCSWWEEWSDRVNGLGPAEPCLAW
jgi:hypothetical protein